jgi:CRP-like cAMP-binding protein
MYILEEGRVAILKKSEGKDYLLGKLNPGDCFGEMSLMDCMPRSASVFALEDSSAIEILPSTLHQIASKDLEQFTLIEMNMGREVCRRLRVADERIFEQSILAEVEDDQLVIPNKDKK